MACIFPAAFATGVVLVVVSLVLAVAVGVGVVVGVGVGVGASRVVELVAMMLWLSFLLL